MPFFWSQMLADQVATAGHPNPLTACRRAVEHPVSSRPSYWLHPLLSVRCWRRRDNPIFLFESKMLSSRSFSCVFLQPLFVQTLSVHMLQRRAEKDAKNKQKHTHNTTRHDTPTPTRHNQSQRPVTRASEDFFRRRFDHQRLERWSSWSWIYDTVWWLLADWIR